MARRRASDGRQVSPEAEIETLQIWLAGLWEQTLPEELMLSSSVERLLWQEIVAADAAVSDSEAAPLFDVGGLADRAAEAWSRICEWGPPSRADGNATAETRAFLRWKRAFSQRCRKQGWRTSAELPVLVSQAIEDGQLQPPEHMVFAGFRIVSPVLERLLNALRRAGTRAVGEDADDFLRQASCAEPGRISYTRYPSLIDEVRAVAAGIRRDIGDRADATIGVVAGDLSAYREAIERVFTMEFDPEALLVPGQLRERVFDLAGAPALSDYPMVANALDLLALRERDNRFDLLSRILLSPYPRALNMQVQGGNEEGELAEDDCRCRARLEAQLRGCNRWRMALAGAYGLVEEAGKAGATLFAARLEALHKLLAAASVSTDEVEGHDELRELHRSPRAWAEVFVRRLKAMAWPGTAALQDSERVLFGAWREAIAELASLERVRARMTEHEALDCLIDLCRRRLVQPPSPGLQIQAMGLLDAAGLTFDRLYVVGLNSAALPVSPRPHPLLPVAWQRKNRMPFCSAELELELARRSWDDLCVSAPELQVSYAMRGEADEDLLPSPLIADAYDQSSVAVSAPRPWYLPEDDAREHRVEARPPEGSTPPARVLRGGTGLIKDQSLCPFRAMAKRRLAAEPFEEHQAEPTPSTRGRLVHRCLETIWAELKTGAVLKAMDESALSSLCAKAADGALAAWPVAAIPTALRPSLADWLTEMSRTWLHLEQGREQNWEVVVHEGEIALELDAGGERRLKLEGLRIDRVDRLADGAIVVIDYKTSSRPPNYKAWMGERPEEPQLPLYVLARRAVGDDVRAAAFASLSSHDKMSLKGPPDLRLFPLVAGKNPRKDKDWSGWDEEVTRMTANLRSLAAAYLDGRAAVDPKSIKTSCAYCGLEPLCRIGEQAGAGDDGEEGAR